MTAYGVILFYTTSSAMRAEKLLAREGYSVELIPTPRELSSDCGIALRFGWDQRQQIESAVNKAGVEVAGIHHLGTGT